MRSLVLAGAQFVGLFWEVLLLNEAVLLGGGPVCPRRAVVG